MKPENRPRRLRLKIATIVLAVSILVVGIAVRSPAWLAERDLARLADAGFPTTPAQVQATPDPINCWSGFSPESLSLDEAIVFGDRCTAIHATVQSGGTIDLLKDHYRGWSMIERVLQVPSDAGLEHHLELLAESVDWHESLAPDRWATISLRREARDSILAHAKSIAQRDPKTRERVLAEVQRLTPEDSRAAMLNQTLQMLDGDEALFDTVHEIALDWSALTPEVSAVGIRQRFKSLWFSQRIHFEIARQKRIRNQVDMILAWEDDAELRKHHDEALGRVPNGGSPQAMYSPRVFDGLKLKEEDRMRWDQVLQVRAELGERGLVDPWGKPIDR